MAQTQPKPRFPECYIVDPNTLAGKRYGTKEMVEIWGAEQTFQRSLDVQAEAVETLAVLYPDVVSMAQAEEIRRKANLASIDPNRIRELEAKKGHDVIAINTALEEVVSREAAAHINQARTSADTTETAKALQLKASLEVIADTVENLRDIMIEKALGWIDTKHMDQSHHYDALPTLAGRPFIHYVEMLQSGLKWLRFVYDNSIIGKWGDATGNHHSAVSLGMDGMLLQEVYCNRLGIRFMDASAQIPGQEFIADVTYVMARLGETVNNIANYIQEGRGSDVGLFVLTDPKKKKGSSAMPHKDMVGGNPTAEEQVMSLAKDIRGKMSTALCNCEFDYARDLSASANSRLNLEAMFKFFDHAVREMSRVIYYLELDGERSEERVQRTRGVVTAQQVMNYLTDSRKVSEPMTRKEAHDLTGRLATESWQNRRPYIDVLLESEEITSRLDEETLRQITDPMQYIGQSREIIHLVASKYHGKRTLEVV